MPITQRSNSLSMINPLSCTGQIQLIIGPMFSGKTTELLRRVQRYSIARATCLLVKYSGDMRYDTENVVTHDKLTVERANVDKITCSSLKSIGKEIDLSEYDCIGIDEGQFYPGLIEFCENAANMGIVVVVAALSGDFERKAFNNILNLIPLSEDVSYVRAVCMSCYNAEASFTYRIDTLDKQVEKIGGPESYKAFCRKCYMSHSTKNGISGGA